MVGRYDGLLWHMVCLGNASQGLTGSDNDDMRREAMGLGCVAYLNKPFVESQLLDAIASAIRLSLVHGGVQSL